MNEERDRPDCKETAVEALEAVLDSAGVREDPQFVEAVACGKDVEVTVRPESVDEPGMIGLQIVGAAVIPRRPRRRRKPEV